ncbi:MAG: aldehyde dehydrogenase, partial [Gammaproteobacteria bacterium]|nr:aldehyde dehydrogenase [Gammaproteobacteria bacterium]
MVEEQGMAVLDSENRGLVLDFLAQHFNENRGG